MEMRRIGAAEHQQAVCGAGAAHGLLVLGSADAAHFHPGMATDFLERVAELVAAALMPHAAPA